MSRLLKSAAVLVLSITLVFAAPVLTACNRSQKSQGGSSSGVKGPAAVSADLLGRIPKDSFGFMAWDAAGNAYKKFLASPWNTNDNESFFAMLKESPEARTALDMFQRAGIDPYKKETWESMFARSVVFISPNPSSSDKPAAGAFFNSAKSINLEQRMSALKQELAKSKDVKLREVKLAKGQGFGIKSLEGEPDNPEVFVGWNGQDGVLATEEALASAVLAGNGTGVPAIINGVNYKKATDGFPATDNRIFTGFVDLAAIAAKYKNSKDPNKPNFIDNLPVEAASMSMAMDSAPEFDVRLVYNQAAKQAGELFASLKSSTSGSLLPAVPSAPLFFLSLDGKTLGAAKQVAGGQLAAGGMDKKVEFLNSISRLGLAARVGSQGQSFLPIPDVLIVAESTDPAKVRGELLNFGKELIAGSGVPGMGVQRKQIAGVDVSYMMTPMQVGMFVASKGNLVIASSNEAQMRSALGSDGVFSKSLGNRGMGVFRSQPTVGNLYVNFSEVASLMETMGALLVQFAPGNQDVQKWLEPKRIAELRKMGTMIGSMTHGEGLLAIKSFYQVSATG